MERCELERCGMDSEPGRSLILWTARSGVACYLLAIWVRCSRRRQLPGQHTAFPGLWTVAWLLMMAHVGCAYHFEHRWSQAAAVRHTAEMTERVVGWYWSGGLYINYVFLLAWGIDALSGILRYSSGSAFTMHAVAAFMMFNATIVFGPPWWVAVAGLFLVALCVARTNRSTQHGLPPGPAIPRTGLQIVNPVQHTRADESCD